MIGNPLGTQRAPTSSQEAAAEEGGEGGTEEVEGEGE